MNGGLFVLKGHGTQNDFVLVPDLEGARDLSAGQVQALCDRRAGIGADGVLRVVRTANIRAGLDTALAARVADTEFFMDYRNADGSIAEMCGNGLRVFVRYLLEAELLPPGPARIGTRAGSLAVCTQPDGQITVDLGPAGWIDAMPSVFVPGMGAVPAIAVSMPNPHVIVTLDSSQRLAGLDLHGPPVVDPGLPDGQNVEFVVRVGEHHLAMRVHERGSGETRSCGTGIGAVVAAAARTQTADGSIWRVDVPGGTCTVQLSPSGSVLLTGPAVIVAAIELNGDWLAAAEFSPTA